MSISEERAGSSCRDGRNPPDVGGERDGSGSWWVAVAATAALFVLLCIRNRFLFSTRLYEDADMGATPILIEEGLALHAAGRARSPGATSTIPGPPTCTSRPQANPCSGRGCTWSPPRGMASLPPAYALNGLFLGLVTGVGYGWTRLLRGAAACFAVVVAFAALHPAVLSTDWMPYLYVPAYIAFHLAAASVAAGGARDAWIMTLAPWFLIHGHACFLIFVPVISCAVLAAVLWPRRHRLGASARSFFATQPRVWVPVAVISAVFAFPIIRQPGAALAGPVR